MESTNKKKPEQNQ